MTNNENDEKCTVDGDIFYGLYKIHGSLIQEYLAT